MPSTELTRRILEAEQKQLTNVNCFGFVLFALEILFEEQYVVLTREIIRRYLEVITKTIPESGVIPSDSTVLGVYARNAKHYSHFALFTPTEQGAMVTERPYYGAPVRTIPLEQLTQEYVKTWGADAVEFHFMRSK